MASLGLVPAQPHRNQYSPGATDGIANSSVFLVTTCSSRGVSSEARGRCPPSLSHSQALKSAAPQKMLVTATVVPGIPWVGSKCGGGTAAAAGGAGHTNR